MTVASPELLPRREPGGGRDEAGQHGDEGRVLAAVSERYRASCRAEKTIIDEFAATTGYHRKHAMRVLALGHRPSGRRQGRRGASTERPSARR